MTASDRVTTHPRLATYNEMRDFGATPEPAGETAPAGDCARFVVQKHDASQLHYDFRLEIDGVLVSWSIPRGPSLNPSDRRLAMQTEDHPLAYAAFEGHIPEGQYGAGDVIVWDEGCFHTQDKALNRIPDAEADAAALAGLERGDLKFELEGQKLRGSWALVKMKGREENAWLLIKHNDTQADRENDITQRKESVISGQLLPRDRGEPSTAQRRRAAKQKPDTA
jgi:bifunctional non-homologous end joining protein LigD